MSKPFGPNTIPVNVIGPWHFGHGGRSISLRPGSAKRDCGMFARLRSGGSAKLPVTGSGQKGTVMPDQCLKVHPVPRTKGQPRLKLGHEPLGRRAKAIAARSIARKLVILGRRWCVSRLEGCPTLATEFAEGRRVARIGFGERMCPGSIESPEGDHTTSTGSESRSPLKP